MSTELTGRAFWYAQAASDQRRAADESEDARTYADRDSSVSLTVARALQHKSAKTYAVARAAIAAAEELPE